MAKNKYQQLILQILGTKPIAFNPILANALNSVKAGLFLSQLLYWWEKGHTSQWIYKTIEEITKETSLSRWEQEEAIKICKKYQLLKVELKGVPAKRHFQLDIERIIKFLEDYAKNASSVCGKTTN